MSTPPPAAFAAILCLLALPGTTQQHAPTVERLVVEGKRHVQCTVRWPNSWHNDRNHDGAWLVLRGPDATRGPLRLADAGHAANGEVPATLTVSADRLGLFVAPAKAHRGDVAWQLTLNLADDAPATVTAWPVGMVFVPAGGFELGDDDALVCKHGAFHRRGEHGNGTFPVVDESELRIADEPGALWYERDRAGYQGDQGGPLPAAWPKGTKAFWIMKHELTQGAYAAFLDALPREWQERRAPLVRTGEETDTCSLARVDGRIVATAPDRPCNFVSWDDTCAWMDWLALRPMTEFEFEKAARGPTRPVAGDYPWGTASMARMLRRVQKTRDLALAGVADEATLAESERERLGASYYWVMDLAGSLWERVVSAGHPAGRAFTGTHGDGVLTVDGLATNADWPRTDADGENAPGMGYRGGAEYWTEPKAGDPTNPCSRTATRTYAGWGGAQRTKTYSARGARSVNR